ncbi:hypothetical protein [Moraxella oblonga]|uniref:hypothetical protein n=1 Tax=Moraxella oblonga TaxID=200413 RepID=UPI00082C0EEB|nr:hypothetical protein [Moraxella oblonga]
MQLTTIKQNDGIFIPLPKDMMANVENIVSNFDDNTKQIQIIFYSKQENDINSQIQDEVKLLSGSLKPYIGTDNEVLSDDEKAFLQAILDDDNRIKTEYDLTFTQLKRFK